jgi:hypothetical protein
MLRNEHPESDDECYDDGEKDLLMQDVNENGDNIQITIKTFEKLESMVGNTRSVQEYCQPHSLETHSEDYDDVCAVAV